MDGVEVDVFIDSVTFISVQTFFSTELIIQGVSLVWNVLGTETSPFSSAGVNAIMGSNCGGYTSPRPHVSVAA